MPEELPDLTDQQKDEALQVLLEMARRHGHCMQSKEVDYHEYEACGTCADCKTRQALAKLGFKGFWS